MKLLIPLLADPLDLDDSFVNTIIVENPHYFYTLVSDLYSQTEGIDGAIILSDDGKPISFVKNAELISQFFPFGLNHKNLVNKISSDMEKRAMTEMFGHTTELLSRIESFLIDLSLDYRCNVSFPRLSIGAIIKASGVEIQCDSSTICEKLLDYMGLASEIIDKRVFITVNLRCYISDEEAAGLLETVTKNQYSLIMLESIGRKPVPYEKRIIIDEDLCVIR